MEGIVISCTNLKGSVRVRMNCYRVYESKEFCYHGYGMVKLLLVYKSKGFCYGMVKTVMGDWVYKSKLFC